MEKTTWLPAGWRPPDRVQLTPADQLRPIRATDVDLDMHAALSSQARLWSIYGAAWGWPPARLTVSRTARTGPITRPRWSGDASFNYALFDTGETQLPGGGIYVDQPLVRGTGAEISWRGRRLAGRWADRRFWRLRGAEGQP